MKCNFLHSSAFSAFIFRGIWTTVSSQTNKVLPKHWQSAFLEKFIFRKAEDKTCEKTACWTKCPGSWGSYNSLIHCFVLLMSLFNVFTGQSLSSCLLSVHSTLQDPHPCSCSLSLSRAFCTHQAYLKMAVHGIWSFLRSGRERAIHPNSKYIAHLMIAQNTSSWKYPINCKF